MSPFFHIVTLALQKCTSYMQLQCNQYCMQKQLSTTQTKKVQLHKENCVSFSPSQDSTTTAQSSCNLFHLTSNYHISLTYLQVFVFILYLFLYLLSVNEFLAIVFIIIIIIIVLHLILKKSYSELLFCFFVNFAFWYVTYACYITVMLFLYSKK